MTRNTNSLTTTRIRDGFAEIKRLSDGDQFASSFFASADGSNGQTGQLVRDMMMSAYEDFIAGGLSGESHLPKEREEALKVTIRRIREGD